jgi:hypothetical protein
VLVTVLPPVKGVLNEKLMSLPDVDVTTTDAGPGTVVKLMLEVFPEVWDVPFALIALTLNA